MTKAKKTTPSLLTPAAIDADPTFLYGCEFAAIDADGKEIRHTKHAGISQGHDFHKRTRDGVSAQTVADAMGNARERAPASWRFDSEAGHLFSDSLLFTVPGGERDKATGLPVRKEVEAQALAGVEFDPQTGAPFFVVEVLDEDGELRPYNDRVTGRPAGAKNEKRYTVSINLLEPAPTMLVGISVLPCGRGERLVIKAEKGARVAARVERRAAKRDGVATEDKVSAHSFAREVEPGVWRAGAVHSAGKNTVGMADETFTGPDAEVKARAAASAIEALFSA